MKLKLFLLLFLLLSFFSCSSTPQKLDPVKNYKLDLFIQNKDISFEGIGVLKKKELYTIELEASEKIDILSFRTCSREAIVEDPRRGISRKKYLINYRPNEIELEGNCSAIISTFNDKLYYSVAMIDFEDDFFKLPAELICGSLTQTFNGVSVCQERVSSIVRIKFDSEVLTSPDKGCELESGNRGKIFQFNIKSGYCTYDFIDVKNQSRIHKLTTYGYDEIIMR